MTDEQLRFRQMFEAFLKYWDAWQRVGEQPDEATAERLIQAHRAFAALSPLPLDDLAAMVDRCTTQIEANQSVAAEVRAAGAPLDELHRTINIEADKYDADAREILQQAHYIGPAFIFSGES